MLDVLIAVILGIVEGITEWLPISSTGHMILVEQFLHMSTSHEFNSMFRVVIQLGAIMAVVVLYFNKLNPFSKRKSAKQKRNTINLWCKIVVACLPAAVIGLLFDDILDKYLYNYVVVALMLIIYGVFFILIEKRNEHRRLPGPGTDPGYFTFRSNHPWSTAHRNFPLCGNRIYLLPCNPGYVRSKYLKGYQIRIPLYRDRSGHFACGMPGSVLRIRICNQVFDGIYQEA